MLAGFVLTNLCECVSTYRTQKNRFFFMERWKKRVEHFNLYFLKTGFGFVQAI